MELYEAPELCGAKESDSRNPSLRCIDIRVADNGFIICANGVYMKGGEIIATSEEEVISKIKEIFKASKEMKEE